MTSALALSDELDKTNLLEIEENRIVMDRRMNNLYITRYEFREFSKRIDERFNHLESIIDERFKLVDMKFGELDKKFEAVDIKFEAIDKRFEAVDKRFEEVNRRFDKVDDRFNSIENDINDLKKILKEHIKSEDRHFKMWVTGLIVSSIIPFVYTIFFK